MAMKSIVAAVAALAAGVSAIDSLRASSARGRMTAGTAFEVPTGPEWDSDRFTYGGIHCGTSTCDAEKYADYFAERIATIKAYDAADPSKPRMPLVGYMSYEKMAAGQAAYKVESDADKLYVAQYAKGEKDYKELATMLSRHTHYLAVVAEVAEKALTANGMKEWRLHSDCAMDHKDAKLGWQLCDHTLKTPENPFLEFSKALKETTDTMAMGDYMQSFQRVSKTADDDLKKVVDHTGDIRAAKYSVAKTLGPESSLGRSAVAIGEILNKYLPQMEARVKHLLTVKTKSDRVKEQSLDTALKQLSAEKNATQTYAVAKKLCDKLNVALWGLCGNVPGVKQSPKEWADNLDRWNLWLRVRRPDILTYNKDPKVKQDGKQNFEQLETMITHNSSPAMKLQSESNSLPTKFNDEVNFIISKLAPPAAKPGAL